MVERHIGARWVVRVFSRLAAVHVFVGLVLLGVAILALDSDEGPGNAGGGSGGGGGSGSGGAIGIRFVGAYAVVASTMCLITSVFVWLRYRRRRWFN